MLAKHGLVVWGDSAEEAYRRTIEVINRAVEFVNAKTPAEERFDGALAAPSRSTRDALLLEVLPTLRGAVSSERHKVLVVDPSASRARVRLLQRGAELTDIGAACPDHLVHTKRVPMWVRFDPASEDARRSGSGCATRAARYREDYRAYVDRARRRDHRPGDPDRASC